MTYTAGYRTAGSSSYPGGTYTHNGRSDGSPSGLSRNKRELIVRRSSRPASSISQGSMPTVKHPGSRQPVHGGPAAPEPEWPVSGRGSLELPADLARWVERGVHVDVVRPWVGHDRGQFGRGQVSALGGGAARRDGARRRGVGGQADDDPAGDVPRAEVDVGRDRCRRHVAHLERVAQRGAVDGVGEEAAAVAGDIGGLLGGVERDGRHAAGLGGGTTGTAGGDERADGRGRDGHGERSGGLAHLGCLLLGRSVVVHLYARRDG